MAMAATPNMPSSAVLTSADRPSSTLGAEEAGEAVATGTGREGVEALGGGGGLQRDVEKERDDIE